MSILPIVLPHNWIRQHLISLSNLNKVNLRFQFRYIFAFIRVIGNASQFIVAFDLGGGGVGRDAEDLEGVPDTDCRVV